ncbi:phospholipid carrier-dependent glycosyltransferase [Fontivita pretiosa]|uniref:phospholipid carrier-dependent glycosyltransferase n=1 Tax=Fontivita pretiosa TaxID=2989684 RepID=UPI003D180ED2
MLDARRRALFVLLLLAIVALYLVGNHSVSLWDRDEPRYAQTSRQMLASGDWVVPRLLDEPREKKPVFVYWCQAAAMALLGDNAFAARLPSVIGVALTIVIITVILGRTIGVTQGRWTAIIFATSALTIAAAKMSITDGVLILFITTAQLCLYAIWQRRATWPIAIVMGLAVGFAALTKGPVVLGVMLMTLLALAAIRYTEQRTPVIIQLARHYVIRRRPVTSSTDSAGEGSDRGCAAPSDVIRTRSTAPAVASSRNAGRGGWTTAVAKAVVAILLALAVLAPWLYAIEQRLPGYTLRTLKAEVFERARKPQEGHKGPPGYYLLTIWGTYFPWSLLLPAAMVSGWRNRHRPPVRFALAAVIGPWIMFEIVQTKLPHYLLPVFPALAYLTADMLIRGEHDEELANRAFLRVVLVWGGIVVAISLLPWLAMFIFGSPPLPGLLAMILLPIVAMEYARSTYVHFRAARPLDAAAVMAIGMILLVGVLYGLYLPNARYLQISRQLAERLKAEGATRVGDAMMIDYKEMSLAFYQGGTIRPQRDDEFLVNTPPFEWPRWIVMTEAVWKRMPPQVKSKLDVIHTVRGLNYAGKDADGRHMTTVHLLRRKPLELSESDSQKPQNP